MWWFICGFIAVAAYWAFDPWICRFIGEPQLIEDVTPAAIIVSIIGVLLGPVTLAIYIILMGSVIWEQCEWDISAALHYKIIKRNKS